MALTNQPLPPTTPIPIDSNCFYLSILVPFLPILDHPVCRIGVEMPIWWSRIIDLPQRIALFLTSS